MRHFLKRNYLGLLLLSVLIVLSLFIKLQSIGYFLNTDNVFSTHDAFRYARFAKELQNNTYGPIDYLVNVPDFRPNVDPPYLLSLLGVSISDLLSIRLEILFAVLPPVLSVLFLIPFYFWIKTFSNPRQPPGENDPMLHNYMFAGGGFLGIFNFIYTVRTPPGYFDTDCLILCFIFAILLFVTCAVKEKENNLRSYIFIVLAALTLNLFFSWYDVFIFAPYFTFSLIAGLLLFRHAKGDILRKALLFIVLINPLVLWRGLNIKEYLVGVFFKKTVTILPISIFSTINEFQPINLKQFVSLTTDNHVSAIMACIGLIGISIYYYKYIIIALPILLTGLTTFKSGNRFLMYLAPFLGMGIGFVMYFVVRFIHRRFLSHFRSTLLAGLVFVIFFSFPPQRLYYNPVPFIHKELFEDFKKLKDITEKDAFIWTLWDYGFAIEYLAERGTYIDGGNYHPIKLYFISHSLMTNDEDRAAQEISFLTNKRTEDYLKEDTTLAEVKQQISLYKLPPLNPVYVVIDELLLTREYLYMIGIDRQKIEKSMTPLLRVAHGCDNLKSASAHQYDCSIFKFNDTSMDIVSSNGQSDVKKIFREAVYIDRSSHTVKPLFHNDKSSSEKQLQIIRTKERNIYFMIADPLILESILNRMYTLRDNFRNFELVYDDFPYMVVYRAKS
ncbi:MAG: STT3 domain-containing protein [Dissulfurispiraceae bacterium]